MIVRVYRLFCAKIDLLLHALTQFGHSRLCDPDNGPFFDCPPIQIAFPTNFLGSRTIAAVDEEPNSQVSAERQFQRLDDFRSERAHVHGFQNAQ